jgi:hypothetical protein
LAESRYILCIDTRGAGAYMVCTPYPVKARARQDTEKER